jgi:hypothetical protein
MSPVNSEARACACKGYKLASIGLFLVAAWILFGILSFGLLVPVHGPSSGYAVHDSEGDEADEL